MRPVLFTVPPDWDVGAYGFFAALALVLAWSWALRLARADQLGAPRLGPVFVASAAMGVVGARAAWIVQHPGSFEGARSLITFEAGTLAPFAGVVVMLVVGGAWVSRYRIPTWAWYDVLAPGFAVGAALERVGAFLAGAGFGRYAPDALWAVRFPQGSPAFALHQRTLANLMKSGATESLPVHPTQLYAVVLALFGLVVCAQLRKRRVFSGQIFLGFGIYYLLTRSFVEEFMRADAPAAVLGPLSGGQIGAAVMSGVLGVAYFIGLRRAAAGDERVVGWEGGRWTPVDEHVVPSPAHNKAASKARGKASGKRRGKKR